VSARASKRRFDNTTLDKGGRSGSGVGVEQRKGMEVNRYEVGHPLRKRVLKKSTTNPITPRVDSPKKSPKKQA
jgi:hypothetical protein